MLVAAAMLAACGQISYYAQLTTGQWSLLSARQPIDRVIDDSRTDPLLRERLRQVSAAREWAVRQLLLPDNGSYTSYVELDRPYVVWNVFATPEFSLSAVEHCFPIAGCLAYQGYYSETAAQQRAQELAADGNDVYVGGVPAYSTLGWFDDPVISTMMRWDDAALIGTLFHELAHQKLYVKGDTVFNESFAQFVQEAGLEAYRAERPALPPRDPRAHQRAQQFAGLIEATRNRLQDAYAAPMSLSTMRAAKADAFARLRADYVALRDGAWEGVDYYAAWFSRAPLNNARLLPFGLYDAYVPAFRALFYSVDGRWAPFYAEAERLAALPPEARQEALEALRLRAQSAT